MAEVYLDIHRELIESCRQGDSNSYHRIYKLYSKAMFNTALRIIKNEQDAEDILQESFVNAFTNLKAFSGTSTFGAWLKRIVINRSINYLRKKTVNVLSLDDNEIELPPEVEENHDDNSYDIESIKAAIDELPDGYRLVFTLYLLEGYDHQEIAQILNISVSTSKSQYNRAKKKILLILKEKEVYYG